MRFLSFAAALVVAAVAARPAHACGGFFCSQAPMDQAGEQIVFSVSANHVQAHVQIQYAGDADQFAWVVPVHAVPTLSVGSAAMFTYLQQRTTPYFSLSWDGAGQCGIYPPAYASGATEDGGTNGGGHVDVISQQTVGPYDSAVLSSTDAGALQAWLRANSYDLTPEGEAALVPYVNEGFYFVALKLSQDKGVGDLRPIVLDFTGDVPCIPIRLTAIAAKPDMPITAYVLASARAVPTNYRHVLINEARIDWFNFGSNYRSVASLAVDEAGGRAFLTEAAGTTSTLLSGSRLDDGRLNTATLAGLTDPVDFVLELQRQNFPRDGLLPMLEKYVPEPASLKAQGIDSRQFYNQIETYRQAIANDPGRAPFDAAAFASELETTVVEPLRRAQAALDSQPYLTRLFTTMSPAEMTLDPEFAFNSSLGDVPVEHRATVTCDATDTQTARITLADGRSFSVPGNGWGGGPIPAAEAGPAAARIEQLASMGPPSVITDNVSDATQAGCGCGAVDLGALMLMGLAARVRRRA